MSKVRITQTNGNAKNGINGSRLRIWNKDNEIVDEFVVPSYDAKGYCRKYQTGRYAKRLRRAVKTAHS